MGSTVSFVWCLIALAMAAMATTATASTTHKVGGDQGWRVPKDDPSFYARWAVDKTFVVGDKLGNKPSPISVFVFLLSRCSFLGSICLQLFRIQGHNEGETPLHELSPVTISLDTAGSKYFICAIVPHCSFRQKLSVIVESASSTTPPAPAWAPSSAPSPLLANALYAAMRTIGSMFFIFTYL